MFCVCADCGNGVLDDKESCDMGDNNEADDDGCTECLADRDYDCFVPENATISVCWICETVCKNVHREACPSPGTACGGCAPGFTEISETCVPERRVIYVPITSYDTPESPHCVFHDLGMVSLTSESYEGVQNHALSVVRHWESDRSARAFEGACSLEWAISSRNMTEKNVFVMELFLETTGILKRLPIDGNVYAVLFSERQPKAILEANYNHMFDVYFPSKFIVHNVHLRSCAGHDGGIARNLGFLSLDSVEVSDCVSMPLQGFAAYRSYTMQCRGILMNSYVSISISNSYFHNLYVEDVNVEHKCVTENNAVFSLLGEVTIVNTTFRDIYGEFRIFEIDGPLIVRDTTFEDIVAGLSMLTTSVTTEVSNLIARNITGSGGAVFAIIGEFVANGFEIRDCSATDDGGIIRTSGVTTLRNGIIHGSKSADRSSGAVVNARSLTMEDVTFLANEAGALRLLGSTSLFRCTFTDNVASSRFSTIYNSGALVVDHSSFQDAEGAPVAIASDYEFVVRDSILQRSDEMAIATCDSVVWYPGATITWRSPCGTQAVCNQSEVTGVSCSCPLGYYGDASEMCAPPAQLYIMPDAHVTVFVIKDTTTTWTSRGLISDGMGTLQWQLDPTTVPPWVRF
eukprot:Rmarinus@m.28650